MVTAGQHAAAGSRPSGTLGEAAGRRVRAGSLAGRVIAWVPALSFFRWD